MGQPQPGLGLNMTGMNSGLGGVDSMNGLGINRMNANTFTGLPSLSSCMNACATVPPAPINITIHPNAVMNS